MRILSATDVCFEVGFRPVCVISLECDSDQYRQDWTEFVIADKGIIFCGVDGPDSHVLDVVTEKWKVVQYQIVLLGPNFRHVFGQYVDLPNGNQRSESPRFASILSSIWINVETSM